MKHQKPDLIWNFYALQTGFAEHVYSVDIRCQDLRLCHIQLIFTHYLAIHSTISRKPQFKKNSWP